MTSSCAAPCPTSSCTNDPAVRALLATADKVKDAPVTVLITGESGTGKEVLARYIHYTGARRDGTFVSINCAALSESLLLSRALRPRARAHSRAPWSASGASSSSPTAGTLFLDEIGDMSLDTQAKLLRVIEESSFERLGGTKRISVDARIIAATNKDLPTLIRREVPGGPLLPHQRRVPPPPAPAGAAGRHPRSSSNISWRSTASGTRANRLELSRETMAALEAWDWPGNVRELENTVNQIVLLGEKSFLAPDRPGAPRVSTVGRSPRAAARTLEPAHEAARPARMTGGAAIAEGGSGRRGRPL